MKEDIKNVIDEQFNNINPTLDDVYNSNSVEDIQKMIEGLNRGVDTINYKNELLKILDHLKELNVSLDYDKNMSVSELEEIINSIKL